VRVPPQPQSLVQGTKPLRWFMGCGHFVLAPFLRVHVEPQLARWFGWLPLFQGSVTGIGLLTGGVILAIMVTPSSPR